MFTAKRRLLSKDKEDTLYGIAFYASIFSVFCFALFLSLNSDIIKLNIFWIMLFSLIGISLYCLVLSTKDDRNPKKIHKSTLDYYIADLNMARRGVFSTDKHAGNNGVVLFFICFAQGAFLFISVYEIFASSNFWISILYLLNLSLFAMCIRFNGSWLNEQKVSSKKMMEFDNLEDVNREEKDCFKRSARAVINENGFINRRETSYIAKELAKIRDKRVKTKNERLKQEEHLLNESLKEKAYLLNKKLLKEEYKDFTG